MKLEIDLAKVLSGGAEDIEAGLHRAVVAQLADRIDEEVSEQIRKLVSAAVTPAVKEAIAETLPRMMEQLMDHPFLPVTQYGEKGETTTVRKQVILGIQKLCMINPNARWDSDKTPFHKAVTDAVTENMAKFQKEYHREVDARFVMEAMGHAASKLRERLGIK